MGTSSGDFVAHVAARAGVDIVHAERAARAVLSGLGPYLSGRSLRLVSSELPPLLSAELLAGESRAESIEERLIGPGTSLAHAHELVASVCRVLTETLSAEALAAIVACLPSELARLLVPSGPEAPRAPVQPRYYADDNPHAARKLSSAPSPTGGPRR